ASAALPSVATVSRTPSFRSAVRRALAFSASRTPFTCLPVPTRIPRYSKTATIPPLTVDDHVFLRRRQDFFDRGEAPEHHARTVVAHRVHALRDRGPLDRLRVRALQDEGAHGVVDDEELVDAAPAHEPLLHALIAAARLVEDRRGAHLLAHELVVEPVDGVLRRDHAAALPRKAIGVEAELGELVVRGRVGHLAVLAEHADEALGEDADDAGAHQEGLDLHLDEAGDGAGRVVGVDGREHEVAGEGGVDGDLRRLLVTDLADHDHVRILPEEGAQRAGEGEPDPGVDVDLVDAA